jgi:hypothetical protein
MSYRNPSLSNISVTDFASEQAKTGITDYVSPIADIWSRQEHPLVNG